MKNFLNIFKILRVVVIFLILMSTSTTFALDCSGWMLESISCNSSQHILTELSGLTCYTSGPENIKTVSRSTIGSCETVKVTVYRGIPPYGFAVANFPFHNDPTLHWIVRAVNIATQQVYELYNESDMSISGNFLEVDFSLSSLPTGAYILKLDYDQYSNGQSISTYSYMQSTTYILNTNNFNLNFNLTTFSENADCFSSGFCAEAVYDNPLLEFMNWQLDNGTPMPLCNTNGQCFQQYCNDILSNGMHELKLNFNFPCCSVPTSITKTIYKGALSSSISVVNNCGNSTLTATTTPTGTYSYQWARNGVTIGGAIASQISATQSGIYTVTVSNPGICTTTASATVNILTNCCLGDVVQTPCFFAPRNLTYGDVNISTIYADLCGTGNVITTTAKIAVNGILTIDNGFFWSIQNTPHFTFGPNASINNSNGSLIILNSTLKACGNEMWQGIRMIGGGFLYTDNNDPNKITLIADAKEAVYLENSISGCYLWNTRFYRNNVSVKMQNLTNPTFDIQGCTIKFDLNDNLTYPLLTPHANKRPDVGILVGLSSNVVIGTTNGANNVFDGLNCGIHTQFSSFTVNKNIFQNIRRYNGAGSYYGCGINSLSLIPWYITPASATIKTVVGAITQFTPPTFLNCDTAIFMNAMSCTADNNKFENVKYGIMSFNSTNQAFDVKNNQINNTTFGITLNNSPGSINRISNNIITGIANPSLRTVSYGISQQEPNTSYDSDTKIFQNTIYGGRNCIQLNTCKNSLVSENLLYQTGTTTVTGNQACIYTANCHSIYINNNSMSGNIGAYDDVNPPVMSNQRKSGVEFFNSLGEICSNTSILIGYGFNFIADCSGTNLRNNTITNTKYGVTLKQSGMPGIIGSQGNSLQQAGNLFNAPFNNPGSFRTYTFQSNGFLSPFYSITGNYPSPNGADVVNQEIKTFQSANNPYENCVAGAYSNKTDQSIVFNAGALQAEYAIAEGNIDALAERGFENGSLWLSEKNLFDRLNDDHILRSNDIVLEQFFIDKQASVYAKLKSMDVTKFTLLNEAAKDSALAINLLTDLKGENTQLSNSIIQEANHRLFNDIYLNFLNPYFKGFSQKEVELLFELSNKCPYIDGDAVYRARALYEQINNSYHFDNVELCSIAKPAFKKEQENQVDEESKFFAQFYPNPARQSTILAYELKGNNSGTMILSNSLGQIVEQRELNDSSARLVLNTAHLPSGVYIFAVKSGEEKVLGKLQIVH